TGEEVKTIALTLVTDSEQQVLRKVNSGSRSLDVEGSRFHLLLGAEASKDRLERNLRDYRLIHIAAHGFYDEKAPSFCGLALSQGSGASATGLADQVEIASWNLNAQVVFLSACDTGRGETMPAEGVHSTARAFLLAGARSVISTLWSVGDEAAS